MNYHSKGLGTGPLEIVCEVLGLPRFGLVPEPSSKPSVRASPASSSLPAGGGFRQGLRQAQGPAIAFAG